MACDMLWSTAESQLQYPIRGMVMSASKGRWPNHCGLCGRRGLAEVVARSSSPIPHQRLLFHLIGLAMGPQLVGTFKLQCISFQNFAASWGYLLYTIAWRLRTSRDGSMQPFMARKFWQQTTLYSSFLTIHNCFVKRSYIRRVKFSGSEYSKHAGKLECVFFVCMSCLERVCNRRGGAGQPKKSAGSTTSPDVPFRPCASDQHFLAV